MNTVRINTQTTNNVIYMQQKQINRLKNKIRIHQLLINLLLLIQVIIGATYIMNEIKENQPLTFPPIQIIEEEF